ncbi:hypothetical protein C2S52_005404 [Perilla frutescens var. hirtella]|nr:hypothetical protein C2S51_010275 [Perilla frutescens var. frutescens]KAH6794927.1 hypothetical protein C2S52_005404 [Perilla frutescens var. hirtella]
MSKQVIEKRARWCLVFISLSVKFSFPFFLARTISAPVHQLLLLSVPYLSIFLGQW